MCFNLLFTTHRLRFAYALRRLRRFIICPKRSIASGELRKHYRAKNDVDAFGHYLAENERIWMKYGALNTLFGAGPGIFWRDPSSSYSLRGSRNFFCQVNNARFHRFPIG